MNEKIKQVIPADGWMVSFPDNPDQSDEVIGLVNCLEYIDLVTSIDNFIGYIHKR